MRQPPRPVLFPRRPRPPRGPARAHPRAGAPDAGRARPPGPAHRARPRRARQARAAAEAAGYPLVGGAGSLSPGPGCVRAPARDRGFPGARRLARLHVECGPPARPGRGGLASRGGCGRPATWPRPRMRRPRACLGGGPSGLQPGPRAAEASHLLPGPASPTRPGPRAPGGLPLPAGKMPVPPERSGPKPDFEPKQAPG